MRLCFSTLACPEWSWEEILTFAKDLGYDGVEVRGVLKNLHAHTIPEFSLDSLGATRERLDELGLRISCLATSCELQREAVWTQTRETAVAAIDIAQALEVPFVRVLGDVAPSPMGKVNDFTVRFAAKELGEYAGERGVTVLIETNGAYADTHRLSNLLSQIDMPSVGALWDVSHPVRFFHETPEISYANLKDFVRHVHVKDSYSSGHRLEYCNLGTGDIPLQSIVRLLERGGYDGYYSLEWLKRWESYLEEPGIALSGYSRFMELL